MATEIERKFLLAGDGWRTQFTHRKRIRDGLVATAGRRKVRVRAYDDRATLTIKAKTASLGDAEYEYEIPLTDAEELLATHCDGRVLSKTRYYVPYKGFVWEIDEYDGILSGVVLAEVELSREDVEVPLPSWVGEEITGRPEYRKSNMHVARLAALATDGDTTPRKY
ncbi:CYTH domain-containing protein [Reyranella massiliensis]|uniref:CYTH domain-containing protein n=1 Tax=Reyranella massiliensis TaxID=445220 RepID=UPI0002E9054F|nr:CYTH domain-containing protein [Reyranella massiliensis]